ncbi:MAG: hypothetical protein E7Z77_02140 [Methanobrevibacter sp.]|uniref:hypothetical protein n=1 Tax=Methanobrevibacter sp. TaxID=66852 RepID=UPI0025DCC694|nr:hypothetical protein [Methanobrevibacter sp.]MBE6508193.1 hypothetical protein [Methanobrevibacter sp.]
MNKQDFEIKAKIIRETFNDKRKIKYPLCENFENIYGAENIFTTEDGQVIDLELFIGDFREGELKKYVHLAERLYEKTEKHVSIYIICPDASRIYVKECEIQSEASFTIKLACFNEDPVQFILNVIQEKLKNGEMLDEDDFFAILMIPLIYKQENENY